MLAYRNSFCWVTVFLYTLWMPQSEGRCSVWQPKVVQCRATKNDKNFNPVTTFIDSIFWWVVMVHLSELRLLFEHESEDVIETELSSKNEFPGGSDVFISRSDIFDESDSDQESEESEEE